MRSKSIFKNYFVLSKIFSQISYCDSVWLLKETIEEPILLETQNA